VRRATGLGNWAAALHRVRVTSRRSHPVTWHVVPPVLRRHAAVHRDGHERYHASPWASARLLVSCTAVVLGLLHNGLQLNADKSEVVILGTGHQLQATANITPVEVADSNLIVSDWLKSLGVSPLIRTSGSTATPRCAGMQLPRLRPTSRTQSEVAQTVARSIVVSWLDYCNALLHGAPAAIIVKLQRAQYNLARVVCQRGGRRDAAPLLRSLHWLQVKHRITYKTALLTQKVLTTSTPPYIHDTLTVAVPARPMRSAGAPLLFVPRVNTELAWRAFSVAGPTVFNSLPPKIKLFHSIDIFKRHVKTPLFYDALVCPPPSASVSNDIIGAT